MSKIIVIFLFFLGLPSFMSCGERLTMAMDDDVYDLLLQALIVEAKITIAKKNRNPKTRKVYVMKH